MQIAAALRRPAGDEPAWTRLLEQAAAAGVAGVELHPADVLPHDAPPDRAALRDLRRSIESHGLRVAGFHNLLESHPALSLFAGDTTRTQTRSVLREQVIACSLLGGNVMTLGSPGARRLREPFHGQAAADAAAGFFRGLLPICESRRVTLALDPLPPPERGFLATVDEAFRLSRTLQNPRVRLGLDVRSTLPPAPPILEVLDRCAPLLVHVRVADPGRSPHGEAVGIPHAAIARALAASGFKGWLVLDLSAAPPRPGEWRDALRRLVSVYVPA